ncbi:unnamed protein product [Lymnaea stagnalis]|uniref:Uncharacterized protein n=1 Tax=Lymnaea stagnalis TaxID=6523 RepID=A0AAV2HW52_LYMST
MAKSTMAGVLMALVYVMTMVGVTSAYWKKWYDDDLPKYWNLRSGYCANTRQACSRDVPCCNAHETCLTLRQVDSIGETTTTTFCKDVRYSQPSDMKLAAGEDCVDSAQCRDLCCREYRGARYGKMTICGTPGDDVLAHYTCITTKGA